MNQEWQPGWLKILYRSTPDGAVQICHTGPYLFDGNYARLAAEDAKALIASRVKSEDDEF